MVAECEANARIIEQVADVYRWLEDQRRNYAALTGRCKACGKCCDFDRFDHRLYVTSPELIFLTAHLEDKNIKPMPDNRCPYQIDGKCSVYEYRMAGCRIFCCNGDSDFQGKLSELALSKFKAICMEFQIPYRYTDLAGALNSLAGI